MSGLPTGVDLPMVWAVIVPVGVVTVLLRSLPFALRGWLDGSPLLDFLRIYMPVGVMIVLVLYTFTSSDQPVWVGVLVGLVTLALHAWRRSPALSILAGTGLYVALVNVVL
ncbi:AzlD domain-containing protein [Corynebacterium sp. NML130628]|uniref:AzlD domain-containing protein n=1 Tax=Corynebacterium sp. NML130628 TaxID=1906333 RepID=UPI0008FB7550|nr:AzlD domain-containing protein [Corynebacterium sp. NML130628]OIR43682.1 branched-chain amino acid ABC transporter permease [Corynebacterium sp. NML130628]